MSEQLVQRYTASDIPFDVLPEHNTLFSFVITAEGGDLRIQIGGDASATDGELVYGGSKSTFNNICGKRVSVIALNGESQGEWSGAESQSESESESEPEPTIFADFTLRETL